MGGWPLLFGEMHSLLIRSTLFAAVALIPTCLSGAETAGAGLGAPPKVPRFSVEYMDKTVAPGADFFRYAAGTWLKNNPVPADKASWGGFAELQERNWFLVRQLLEELTRPAAVRANSPAQKVGDFYRSAMDTNRLEQLGFKPLAADFRRIEAAESVEALLGFLAELQLRGTGAFFGDSVSPDAKNSAVYTYYLGQGGLSLPDRDYYLGEGFARQREAFLSHVTKMLGLLGEPASEAQAHAQTVMAVETGLAKVSKSRTDLRDPVANYHPFTVNELTLRYSALPLKHYLTASGLGSVTNLVVRQPEFFDGLNDLVKEHPLGAWKTYLRWHVLRQAAPYLTAAVEAESFAFNATVLRGQPAQEPRWQRSAKVIDAHIGEALGQLYVSRHFPPAARARMNELIGNLKAVFTDRLKQLDWMTQATRAKALAKFDRFTQKIGHPEKFRDYGPVEIRPDDLLGNVQRAARFEIRRRIARVGQPVDRAEWHMTPQTVNAYFNPLQNEIVFPAGILQPPFFDVTLDDAVNYGAIGVVIGHEITHGYDDQGRKYDAEGNLNEWWTEADGKEFDRRAQKVVDQYNGYEALPGLKVNGRLTLGENIADLGGTSLAYEALQRALAKDPAKRKSIDGFTPEQRFFLSLAQLWRINWREAEVRRRITVDPHSPGQFRAIGPHVNMQEFYNAFGIKDGMPMWRAKELRAKIW
jgi:putative endopeptidase